MKTLNPARRIVAAMNAELLARVVKMVQGGYGAHGITLESTATLKEANAVHALVAAGELPKVPKVVSPIEAAVAPLKAEAMDRAEKFGREQVAKVYALLAAADWKVNAVAPYPNSIRMGRKEYMMAKGRRNFIDSLTTTRDEGGKDINGIFIRYDQSEYTVRACSEAVERVVQNARKNAAAQYDAFVGKLVMKVGAHDSATLTGSHVWGFSTLTVARGPVTERWKTQMILNVSKLGKLFNQFPTRKVKS
jgi:hypothetical protein